MTIQDLLNAGFEMKMPIRNYLYGMNTQLTEIRSTLQPDYLFTRDDKSIIISTQGGLTVLPVDNSRYNSEQIDSILAVAMACKIHFIQLKSAGSVVYENYYGIFPTNEVLAKFIS